MSEVAFICVGRYTKTHGDTLKALGYTNELDPTLGKAGHFVVEHSGFVGPVRLDLSTEEGKIEAFGTLKGVVQAKGMIRYTDLSVKWVKQDGDIGDMGGHMVAGRLNDVFPGGSCLVAKPKMGTVAKKAAAFSIADILG